MVRRLAKEQLEPGAAKRDIEGKFDWEMVAPAPGKRPYRRRFSRGL